MAEHTLLSIVQSTTTGERYEIRRGGDSTTYCTCASWRFSKTRPKSCKHLRAYLAALGADKPAHQYWEEACALVDVAIDAMKNFEGRSTVLPVWEISRRRMREVVAVKLLELAPALGLRAASVVGEESSGVRMISLDD